MKEKPISILIQEAKSDIVESINKQQLHSSIIRMILKEIYDEVCGLDAQICENEAKEYEKSQKEKEAGDECMGEGISELDKVGK